MRHVSHREGQGWTPLETERLRDERGTATIEYLVVLITFTIGAAAAVVAIGPSLVELFHIRAMWLSLPIP